ncbi:unnamed protein product [Oikopleura dioica]|uniref:Uncharacterized protein n=1 Tax=Oikopleura dioica TaxID=34765 RepID=E4XIQ7_OIKDI|nr:unnamed protein product [Oikopleura dioica]
MISVISKSTVRIFCEADPQLLELKVRDQHQFTPLLLSAAVGKSESVTCLLELGADLRQRCSKGFSALQVAALNVSSP